MGDGKTAPGNAKGGVEALDQHSTVPQPASRSGLSVAVLEDAAGSPEIIPKTFVYSMV